MKINISKLTAKLFTGTVSLRLLSVILAVCLWSLVINTEDPVETRTFSNVEVKVINSNAISNLNQSYQIKSGERISFSIRGKKSIVDKVKKTDFEVTADLSEMSSVNAVPIKIVAKKYANNIEIVFGNDKTLTLEIEDMQQIQVPVIAETTGKPAQGYYVGTKTTNPNLVSVKGPVSIIKDVKQVKVFVDISGAKEDIMTNLTPVCYDSEGNKVESERITLDTSKIRVNVKVWKSKKIPLVVKTTGTPAEGYTVGNIDYEPQYVFVAGENEDLKEISELELPVINVQNRKTMVEKIIDLTKLSLPDGISLAQSNVSIAVKVNIDQTGRKELSILPENIEVLNNEHNYQVDFPEQKIVFELSGLKTAVANTTVSDLKPQIDIGGLDAGEHTVTLQYKDIQNIKIEGTEQIIIQILEEEETTEEDPE